VHDFLVRRISGRLLSARLSIASRTFGKTRPDEISELWLSVHWCSIY
jgi:hypothetical protein